jgi:hypothetical protein
VRELGGPTWLGWALVGEADRVHGEISARITIPGEKQSKKRKCGGLRIDSGGQACYFHNGAEIFCMKKSTLDGDPAKWRS